MPNSGGFYGGIGSGSRVTSSETFQSETVSPILTGCCLMVLACVFVGLIVADSLILGPGLWSLIGGTLIVGVGSWVAIRAYYTDSDWGWITAAITMTVLVCAAWVYFGYDWLRSIWPASKFVRRVHSIMPWWKVIIQFVIGGCLVAIRWVAIRLRIEILDPGWSRRFERDAAIVGAKPNLPHRGERFPAQKLQRQIEDLEADLEEAQIETRRVVINSSANGNDKTRRIADLPDSNEARAFYYAVSIGDSFSVQTAIKCKCRKMFEKEIRPTFEKLDWAYWIDPAKPRAGMKLRADGWAAITALLPHS